MSKHRARVQFRRKIAARNADKTSDALMDIYRRATQGGSDAPNLTINQESDPERVAKLKQKAQERRDKRNAKQIRQGTNEAVSAVRQPNGQQRRRGIRAQRVGKIRGLARRLLHQTT